MSLDCQSLSQDFIKFCIKKQVLKFGEFKTKAGRISPYFFNTGLFNDGDSLLKLGEFYANSIENAGIEFDMLYGPAYKGIPLVASIAIAFANKGRNLPYAYNRKEVKDHGEGGLIIGAALNGKVLIIDDVISAGTSIRASVNMINASGATACGVVVALDRQEKSLGERSAVQEMQENYNFKVNAIATLSNLLNYLENNKKMAQYMLKVIRYQKDFCIK